MEEKMALRKAGFKAIYPPNRLAGRKEAKADSDQARKELLSSLRESHVGDCMQHPGKNEDLKTKRLFAKTFMHPDTMVEVPDLAAEWSVVLRPEGERCLVIINGSTVSLRSRNGSVIERFVLDLFSVKKTEGVTILDGVYGYKGTRRCVYVFDALLLKQNELIFSDFDFRQFFLNQHWPLQMDALTVPMLETDEMVTIPLIERVEAFPATAENVKRLYESEGDSLLFFKRNGKYVNGLTQDVLSFRDEHMSRYAIDTQHKDGFEGDEEQTLVLRASRKHENVIEFATWDGVVLQQRNEEETEEWIREKLGPGRKKKSTIVKVIVNEALEFLKFKSSGKPYPNSFNRIVDQYRKRRALLGLAPLGVAVLDAAPLSIQDILGNVDGVAEVA